MSLSKRRRRSRSSNSKASKDAPRANALAPRGNAAKQREIGSSKQKGKTPTLSMAAGKGPNDRADLFGLLEPVTSRREVQADAGEVDLQHALDSDSREDLFGLLEPVTSR